MLVLARKQGESLRVGDAVITIRRISGKQVKVTVEAPRDVRVSRVNNENGKGEAA